MTWNWRYFMAATLLAAFLLFNAGAPPFAILAGIGLGAFMTHRATRSA